MNDELDDIFHACALAAYLEEAQACRGWPGSEATKRRAYALYEAELAEKSATKPRKERP